MGISQNDLMLDAALSTIIENVDMITVCAGQPITFDSAITQGGQMLARVLVSANGFAALSNGDSSGRKRTINTHAAIPGPATGGATDRDAETGADGDTGVEAPGRTPSGSTGGSTGGSSTGGRTGSGPDVTNQDRDNRNSRSRVRSSRGQGGT